MNLLNLPNTNTFFSRKLNTAFIGLILMLLIPSISYAQSWAFSSYDSRSNDGIAVFPLVDIPGNTIVYITEDEYSDASNTFFNDEGHIKLTIPSGGILAGTVISIRETDIADTYQVIGGGTASHVTASGSWSLSFGDEVYIYEASNELTPWNSVTEIHSFLWTSGANPIEDQKILSDYPNSIFTAFNIAESASGVYEYLGIRMGTTREMLNDKDNWSNTGTTVSSFIMTSFENPALPVELTRFVATWMDQNRVSLSWTTASELKNDFFEIQYSTDGKRFSTIGKVDGSGTTNNENQYNYNHSGVTSRYNYYRLMQVDYNGQSNYSDVKVITKKDAGIEVTVFPNPFTQTVFLTSIDADLGIKSVEVINIDGKLVQSEQLIVEKGSLSIDLSDLTRGSYILRIHLANNSVIEKQIMKMD